MPVEDAAEPLIILFQNAGCHMQTFDFHKPGDMTQLERNAALSYYNQHYPERVWHAPLKPQFVPVHISNLAHSYSVVCCTPPPPPPPPLASTQAAVHIH